MSETPLFSSANLMQIPFRELVSYSEQQLGGPVMSEPPLVLWRVTGSTPLSALMWVRTEVPMQRVQTCLVQDQVDLAGTAYIHVFQLVVCDAGCSV